MATVERELQKIKGVGAVLAKRFVDAGLDTFEKIAAAGEEKLRAIRGINPRAISAIISQAADLAQLPAAEREQWVAELKAAALTLREQVEGIARGVRDRFAQELKAKGGRKMESHLLKMVRSLERVEAKLETRTKRAGKALAKTEKRLAGLSEAGFKQIVKGLKRARKPLKRVLA